MLEQTQGDLLEALILLERQGRPAPAFVMDPEVTDFYRFTRDSFRLEGYDPLPFDEKIPVAI